MSNNNNIARSGTKWMAVSSIVTAMVGLLRLAILTRFLEKSDFGVVAIITMILGLTQMFSDLGFATAIMHKKDITRREFSSLYWIQFLLFLILYVLITCCSGPISVFYNEESLKVLIPISMLDLVFQGVGRLYGTILQKNFKFKTMSIRNVVCTISSVIIAVMLAYLGAGVYSLIFSSLFATLSLNIWNFVEGQKNMHLSFCLSFKESIPLAKIGLYMTGAHILDYIAAKIDVLIIGRFLGMELLGIYSLAKELLQKIVSVVNSIANNVALPFFSAKQDDDGLLCNMYCKLIHILTFITFPVLMFTTILATPIIGIVYGANFMDAALIIVLLLAWALTMCIHNPIGSIVVAKGRTDLSFYYTIIRLLVMSLAVLITANISIDAVAFGQSVASFIMFFVLFYMCLKKTIGLGLKNFISSFGKHGIVCLVFTAVFTPLVTLNILGIRNHMLSFIIYGVITCGLYALVLFKYFKQDIYTIYNK